MSHTETTASLRARALKLDGAIAAGLASHDVQKVVALKKRRADLALHLEASQEIEESAATEAVKQQKNERHDRGLKRRAELLASAGKLSAATLKVWTLAEALAAAKADVETILAETRRGFMDAVEEIDGQKGRAYEFLAGYHPDTDRMFHVMMVKLGFSNDPISGLKNYSPAMYAEGIDSTFARMVKAAMEVTP